MVYKKKKNAQFVPGTERGGELCFGVSKNEHRGGSGLPQKQHRGEGTSGAGFVASGGQGLVWGIPNCSNGRKSL